MEECKLKLSGKKKNIFICLALALFIILIYWQVKEFKFVYYDDASYVVERTQVMAGLTADGFQWALTATEAGFWHPLTWLSLMIDRELFGNNPGGYHWTNVVLHILNTILLFLFLQKATGTTYRSSLVALFFAIHPLHVESVAWVSQRKDLLCTIFGLAALGAYVNYARSPDWRRYSLVLILFILGLMAKPMIVTIPFVMLLLDYWPLQRIILRAQTGNDNTPVAYARRRFRFLLLEKVPFIILSIVASILVVVTEHQADALTNLNILSVTDRLANAVVSYVKYIILMFWPANLAFFYPHCVTIPILQVLGALLLLAVLTFIVLAAYRRLPYLFTGWFWYLGMLVPVIGLIQVGPHALADRYTYVPLTGLFIIVVWGAADLAAHWKLKKQLLWVMSAVIVMALSFCAWQQVGYWKNSVTLFEHALKIIPDNYIALGNLGQFYINNGEYEKGMAHMHKAIQVKPSFAPFYYNIGLALHSRGNYAEAVKYFAKAEELFFPGEDNRRLLADCYRLTGNMTQAIAAYKKALEINGSNLPARYGLALALMETGQNIEAMKQLKDILLTDSRHLSARKILMLIALKNGDQATVIIEGKKAVANGSADAEVYKMMEMAGRGK
ncbi:MAG: photosystem I assembly protein Ycf3 [Smithella sp. PtaU1.Bin162]|nr:MAG: photosystem I assembly protein Ycf3 [Smithella sp. PtaU1.Bin162]